MSVKVVIERHVAMVIECIRMGWTNSQLVLTTLMATFQVAGATLHQANTENKTNTAYLISIGIMKSGTDHFQCLH